MQTYDFPTFGNLFSPSKGGFNIAHNTEMDVSAVNNSQRIAVNPGESWVVSWSFSVIEKTQAHEMRALLNKLRGHQHTVHLFDHTYAHKIGWPGNPVVSGTGQYGTLLNISTNRSNTIIAKATDRFVLGGQLVELTEDAVTNNAGNCELVLANEIRNIPASGTPLITNLLAMRGVFRWANPSQINQFVGNKRLYRSIKLDFVEYIR